MKPSKLKIVTVWWDDATSSLGEYDGKDDGYLTVSVGFLVKKTRKHLHLATDYQAPDKAYKITHTIPRGMVSRIQEWEVEVENTG